MKFSYLVIPLILLPLYAFSNSNDDSKILLLTPDPSNPNTQDMSYSNESEHFTRIKSMARNIDYPTQIIRMDSSIENQQLTCAEVHDQINKKLVENITNKQFAYAIYVSCHYDPQTYFANQFTINSYFDPITDEAVAFLQSYLNEYNNTDLLGTKLKIEPAKGLIISLSLAAGVKKNAGKPPFIEYRKDRSNFYFKNNYEMKNKLFNDIYDNFYSNDPERVLPFLDKWVFANAGSIYKAVLRDSNYAELQPERIFLMDNGEEIFVSGLKQYFMHHCEKYTNHKCLQIDKE